MERHHIAMLPFSAPGHINPMLVLSRRLVRLDFTVSFLLPEDTYAAFMSKPKSQEQHIQVVPIKVPSHQILTLDSGVMNHVAAVLEALQPPVKCLVSDAFMECTQDLANQLKIPRVALWCSNTITEAFYYYLPLLASKGYYPFKDLQKSGPIAFLPGLPPIQPCQVPIQFREVGHYTPLVSAALRRSEEALCVLTNAVEELEQEFVLGRRSEINCEYLPVGPLIPEASMLGDEHDKPDLPASELKIINWLDRQAPCSVLYIAFGTFVTCPIEQVEKIAAALEASSQPFLWAMRSKFVENAPEKHFQVLQERFPEQGLLVEWTPQAFVLNHTSIGAFFTHCGWNSTLEAICAGVPMLCWPCNNEQNTNSFMIVEQWKVGIKVAEGTDDSEVEPKAIQTAIQEVMRGGQGNPTRIQAHILKGTLRNAFEGGCSQKNLVKLKELVLKSEK